jgi:hypothetical protein
MARQDGRRVAQNIGNDALPLLMRELLDRTYQSEDAKTVAETIGVIERMNGKDDVMKGAQVVVHVNIGDPTKSAPGIEVSGHSLTPKSPKPTLLTSEEIVDVLAPEEPEEDLSMFELDLGALVEQQRR